MSLLILLVELFAIAACAGGGALAAGVVAARSAVLASLAFLAGLAWLAELAGLANGAIPASLALPLGAPGLPASLLVDPIGLAFAFAAIPIVGAAALMAQPDEAAPLAVLLAAVMLTFLAGDALTLALGVGGAAGAALAAQARPGRVAFATVPLLACLLCLAPHDGLLQGDIFPDLRGAGSAGAANVLVLVLAVAAALPLIARPGLRQAAPSAPRGAVALAADAVLPCLGQYLLFRILFDLAGPATPPPWGLVLIAVGLVGAVIAGARAVLATQIGAIGGGVAASTGLLAVAASGLALVARAADLAPLAAAASGGALLLAIAQAWGLLLFGMVERAMAEQAGSTRLAALGGLASTMPATAAGFLAAGLVLSALPPFIGFSGLWLVVETLLAAQRFGVLGLPILLAMALAGMGLAWALACCAWLRLGVIAFLGRPRTPRGAAATDPERPQLRLMAGAGAVLALLSLCPGPLLLLLGPTLRAVAGTGLGDRVGALGLHVVPGGTLLSPPLVAAALAALLAALEAIRRRLARERGEAVPGQDRPREVAVWDGGAAPPPDWLPFGEPLSQPSAAGMSRAVLAGLGVDPAFGTLPGEAEEGAAEAGRQHGFGAAFLPEPAARILRHAIAEAAGAGAGLGARVEARLASVRIGGPALVAVLLFVTLTAAACVGAGFGRD